MLKPIPLLSALLCLSLTSSSWAFSAGPGLALPLSTSALQNGATQRSASRFAPAMQFEMPKMPNFGMPKMPSFPQPGAATPAKGLSKVAVTGSTGLLGSALTKAFTSSDIEVVPLTRGADGVLSIAPELLEGVDAVVHLAGENVATGTGPLAFLGIQAWSDAKKEEIIRSRVEGTQAVVAAINACSDPPKTLVCASGVGFYGFETGDALMTEANPIGGGFLAQDVCAAWEGATAGAKCRVVNARFGVVLAAGGAHSRNSSPSSRQLGGGGIIGSGAQYFSWISARDAVAAIRKILETPSLKGPVNVCAPEPVTNAEFTAAMGAVLGRPTILPFPAFAVSLLFGQMGEEMLLGGQRAVPQKLQAAGFQFQDPTIEQGVAAAVEGAEPELALALPASRRRRAAAWQPERATATRSLSNTLERNLLLHHGLALPVTVNHVEVSQASRHRRRRTLRLAVSGAKLPGCLGVHRGSTGSAAVLQVHSLRLRPRCRAAAASQPEY